MKPAHVYYDAEADYLEVRFGKLTRAYYEELGNDVALRRDEKTGRILGFSVLNVRKHAPEQPRNGITGAAATSHTNGRAKAAARATA
jgi:uncharacterized protein YuzE